MNSSPQRNFASALFVTVACMVGTYAFANKPVNAQDQSTMPNAVEITRKIRAELMSDANLSTYAKNVTVVVKNGLITLKGPVTSEAEKIKISRIANNIAPEDRIDNKIEVKK